MAICDLFPFSMTPPVFHLSSLLTDVSLPRVVLSAAERLLCFPALNAIHSRAAHSGNSSRFADEILKAMNVTVELVSGSVDNIPSSGAVVVVANHPFGGIEGVILLSLLQSRRPEARVMANYFLGKIPELRSAFIFVDPFDTTAKSNSTGLRQTLGHLQAGGALGIFPSGEVAAYSLRRRAITEPTWSRSAAMLARLTSATVLPVFFHGTNGTMFHAAGCISPRLRTVLLPREFANKQHTRIQASIGHLIPPSALTGKSDAEATDEIRKAVFDLEHHYSTTSGFINVNLPNDTAVSSTDCTAAATGISA